MIGNDIVDLDVAHKQGSWCKQRYRDKVFTHEENRYLDQSKDLFQALWRMWSMKESAYKIVIQNGSAHFLNTHKLVSTILDEHKGLVSYNGLDIKTNTRITEDYIYTTAYLADALNAHEQVIAHKESAHLKLKTKQALKKSITNMKGYNLKDVELRKNNLRVPHLYYKDVQVELAFSLSHHGRFGAYAFEKN